MDEFNFEILYELYAKKVFKFLFKLTKNYYLAEELTQETFVRAFTNLDSFEGKSKLLVWLCQIGKNLYFDHIKKSYRRVDFEQLDEVSGLNDLEDEIIQKDEADYILKLMMTLSEPYKTVLFNKIYLELSYKELANEYGKNENWARVTFYRAKCMLQKKLKGMKK